MSDQAPPNNNSGGNKSNNQRRHHNRKRHHPKPNSATQPGQQSSASPQAQPHGQSQNQGQGPGQGQRRRFKGNNPNRPRGPQTSTPSHHGQGGINIERIYEKYLNLLDQHLIARRKYHDLFYRADPGQKNKLERNFYNTLNDIRDFESKLAPEARELFEKRNNGLKPDNIYTSNHMIPIEGSLPPDESQWADPHFLLTQKLADYSSDNEESMGSIEDYLKYKNLN